MATVTTLKLPADLTARIEPKAARDGKTPHAWAIQALRTQAGLAELRHAFTRDAVESAAEVDAGGPLYSMEDVHAYLRARGAGKAARRPSAVKRGGKRSRRT